MTDDAHFRLRLPRSLKEWVEERAKRNNRSINAEIVSYLEAIKDDEESDLVSKEYIRQQNIIKLTAQQECLSDMAEIEYQIKSDIENNNFCFKNPEIITDLLKISEKKIELYFDRKTELQEKWFELIQPLEKNSDDTVF